MRTLRRAGLDIPRQMSVIAVDNHPMSELVDLTTIAQSGFDQGLTAARTIDSMLSGERPESVLIPTKLIVRHTTGQAA